MKDKDNLVIKISVRDLVEFVMRSGDIDTSSSGAREIDAMQRGTKLHKKIQKSMAKNYLPEVTLKEETVVDKGDIKFVIAIEGRADGIILPDSSKACDKSYEPHLNEDRTQVIIHEIKGVLRDVSSIMEAVKEHRAQAMCYAYFSLINTNRDIFEKYGHGGEEKSIGIRVSYYNLESEDARHFYENFSARELEQWFEKLMEEYTKWGYYKAKWEEKRDISIKKLEFPFEYREGQKKLVADVYRTIIRDKKLYLEAPTGVGKTISTVFPAVKAMGEGLLEKIFYLTAKTITRTTAENTFDIIRNSNTDFKYVTITAKEKICCQDTVACNPIDCPRAKGHFDRINDAVFELINNENNITREVIMDYAQAYNVCPFEMCLDVSLWVDAVICDYNYAFDPSVYLRRFFEGDVKHDYVFLVDEAHNLVERACEMYSASLKKEDFLTVKKLIPMYSKKLIGALETCNKEMLKYKRSCEDVEIFTDLGDAGALIIFLMRAITYIDEFNKEHPKFEYKETLMNLYFDMRHFINMYEIIDDDYLIYTYYNEKDEFIITLRCMNPSRNLSYQLKKGKSAIFFSATFLPITYYMNQLGAKEDDYAVYAPSTFDKTKRNILIATDVSTKYTRRTDSEYARIARYIDVFTREKIGNYITFFPSYSFMEKVYDKLDEQVKEQVILQDSGMTEEEREDYLANFIDSTTETKIGFCVLGGIFSEGIDLKNDRLIGAIIVGTGLPMVCTEREIYRGYYDKIDNNGFEFAYLYNGMNKVQQAAGRVIRTYDDVGQILLLDERLLTKQYISLFPREWFPYETVNIGNVADKTREFWKGFVK